MTRFLIAAILCVPGSSAFAQTDPKPPGEASALFGAITTTGDAVRLPGVTVTLIDSVGMTVDVAVSDERGEYRFEPLRPGSYRIAATLAGLSDLHIEVLIPPKQNVRRDLEMDLSPFREQVDVRPEATIEGRSSVSGVTQAVSGATMDQSLRRDGGIESILTTIPGVVATPAGASVRGGSPSQAGLRLETVSSVDPFFGLPVYVMPNGAAALVEVLANPAGVEHGWFSSGLTIVQSRRGGNRWRFTADNVLPAFHQRRGKPLSIAGVKAFAPRIAFGGPVVPSRWFLHQTLAYRFTSAEVFSRPASERRKREAFSSFTRADAVRPSGRRITLTFAAAPERRTFAGLDTFTAPEATTTTTRRSFQGGIRDLWPFRATMLLDSAVHAIAHDVDVDPRGGGPMVLSPEETSGHYFNTRRIDSRSIQWVETLTLSAFGTGGEHVVALGVDLLHSSGNLRSESRAIEIRRVDTTLARRFAFEHPARQSVAATDVALFARDRWRPNAALVIEGGVRVDRDGVTRATTLSPRVGFVFLPRANATSTWSVSVGRFVERTPLAANAFGGLDRPLVQDFAANGTTPLAPAAPLTYRVSEPLRPATHLGWNVLYRHRLGRTLSLRLGHLGRRGRHVLIAEPLADGIRLHSDGRARYWDVEAGVRYTRPDRIDIDASYVRSRAETHANRFESVFATRRDPIITEGGYGPADGDVPHRLLVKADVRLTRQWRTQSLVEWRSGLPYSALTELQALAGSPNAHRFPSVAIVDWGIDRRVQVLGITTWVGLRVRNLFAAFDPADVQRNIASPRFGRFFNAAPRSIGISIGL